MRAILSQLNKTQGVWGSMIVSRDGIVIASDFSIEVHEDPMGAVASQMLSALDGALKRIKLGAFKRFMLSGSENKLALIDAGQTILVVLLRRDINLGLVNVELKQAADAIIQNSKM